jgi:hypothetical protein
MVIETGGRFLRVQIKSTMYLRSEGCYLCGVRPCKTSKPYCRGEFDFVAADVIPEDVWYIIPARVVVHGKRTGIPRTRATRRINTKRTERRGICCVECLRERCCGALVLGRVPRCSRNDNLGGGVEGGGHECRPHTRPERTYILAKVPVR